jgi:ATPase subunit of ABC transporter with duplicated ATPase domains
LKQQLINWQGCIILVSHEEKFYEGIVDKIVRASKK